MLHLYTQATAAKKLNITQKQLEKLSVNGSISWTTDGDDLVYHKKNIDEVADKIKEYLEVFKMIFHVPDKDVTTMPEQEFNVGDLVQLKSGGPVMVIHYASTSTSRICKWFVNGEIKETFCHIKTLEPAELKRSKR